TLSRSLAGPEQPALPGQCTVPQRGALFGRGPRQRVVLQARNPGQNAQYSRYQPEGKTEAPAAPFRQRNGHARTGAANGDQHHGEYRGDAGEVAGKVTPQEAGQQHVADGDADADQNSPGVERDGRRHVTDQQAGHQDQQRHKQGVFDTDATRQWRGVGRHEGKGKQGQGAEQAGGRTTHAEGGADFLEQRPDAGDGTAQVEADDENRE